MREMGELRDERPRREGDDEDDGRKGGKASLDGREGSDERDWKGLVRKEMGKRSEHTWLGGGGACNFFN